MNEVIRFTAESGSPVQEAAVDNGLWELGVLLLRGNLGDWHRQLDLQCLSHQRSSLQALLPQPLPGSWNIPGTF